MCKIFQKAKGVILFFLDMSFNLPNIFYVGHFQLTSPKVQKVQIQSQNWTIVKHYWQDL